MRMLRLLTYLLLVAALVLGRGGFGSFAGAGFADNGATFVTAAAAPANASGAPSPDEGSRWPAILHGCCHSTCPQRFLVRASVAPARMQNRSVSEPTVIRDNPRSIILKRDPPIPRYVI